MVFQEYLIYHKSNSCAYINRGWCVEANYYILGAAVGRETLRHAYLLMDERSVEYIYLMEAMSCCENPLITDQRPTTHMEITEVCYNTELQL